MPDSSPGEPAIVDGEVVETSIAPAPAAPPPAPPAPDYDERGTPSFDYVRDKIEGRFTTSIGSGELADETAAGRTLAEQEAERDRRAKDKLEEIRRSLGT